MSAPATLPPPAAPGPKKSRAPRVRGGRTLRAGASLLAQGEAMIWLTGGALLFCLALIIGLLGLVLVYGGSTFWPSKLLRVETVSGKAYLGEVTRSESYLLTQQAADSLSGPAGKAAHAFLDGAESAEASRQMLRIGNYEVTGNHFQWVSDFEIAPQGESYPEWALLIERLEWGRFIGAPEAFVLHYVRPVDTAEKQLADTVQFLESNQGRLEPALAQALAPELDKLRRDYNQLKARNTAAFVSQLQPEAQATLVAVLDDGTQKPLAELSPDQSVKDVLAVTHDPAEIWQRFGDYHAHARLQHARKEHLVKHDIGRINDRVNAARLNVRREELSTGATIDRPLQRATTLQQQIAVAEKGLAAAEETAARITKEFGASPPARAAAAIMASLQKEVAEQLQPARKDLAADKHELERAPEAVQQAIAQYADAQVAAEEESAQVHQEITALEQEFRRYELRMQITWGAPSADKAALQKTLLLGDIVRAYPANRLGFGGRLAVYFSRWSEFLFSDPREANSEGGVFPAIWGTVAMTLIMSLAVMPFGILAALYLREYAKAGFVVSAVRIAINNLAGVPSIVFGVFGMGFFCYLVGAYIDGGPKQAGLTPWSESSWWCLVLALLATFAAAVVCGLLGRSARRGELTSAKRWARRGAALAWIVGFLLLLVVMAYTPYFPGFFRANLPNPTYGKGALVWASLTLALLTLPVVIVATEEALAAVPNSLREGSYGCGASKWQTIWRIVLPHALPGIMTGLILAMARGAGEVAPLMLVGALKLAPELPLDLEWPCVHLNRSFMHLGFHIFDLGFQSPNSEAAKPMVYTTTLLLITIVFFMNITAVWLRNRLRRRYQTGQF